MILKSADFLWEVFGSERVERIDWFFAWTVEQANSFRGGREVFTPCTPGEETFTVDGHRLCYKMVFNKRQAAVTSFKCCCRVPYGPIAVLGPRLNERYPLKVFDFWTINWYSAIVTDKYPIGNRDPVLSCIDPCDRSDWPICQGGGVRGMSAHIYRAPPCSDPRFNGLPGRTEYPSLHAYSVSYRCQSQVQRFLQLYWSNVGIHADLWINQAVSWNSLSGFILKLAR